MSDDEHSFELVFPFTICASQGGPYADDAFVGGFRLGSIYTTLHTRLVPVRVETVLSHELAQLDLIAMSAGYSCVPDEDAVTDCDEWVTCTLERREVEG